jgi:hypothetical protein
MFVWLMNRANICLPLAIILSSIFILFISTFMDQKWICIYLHSVSGSEVPSFGSRLGDGISCEVFLIPYPKLSNLLLIFHDQFISRPS